MGKHYDVEYKMQAARLVVEEGRKATDLAREIEVPVKTLRNWVKTYKEKKDFVGSGNTPPELKTSKEMEKRIKDLEEENEILKKAMHVFTKKPK